MKYKNEYGEEIECSVEEYKLLHSMSLRPELVQSIREQNEKEDAEPVQKYKRKGLFTRNKNYNPWNKHEENFLREAVKTCINPVQLTKAYNKNFKEKRTINCVYLKARALKLKYYEPIGIVKPTKTVFKKGSESRLKWTKDEVRFLKENSHRCNNKRELIRLFLKEANVNNRTLNGVHFKVYTYRKKLQFKKDNEEKPDYRIKQGTGAKERMSFCQERARYYMKTYAWSYDKARNQAFMDWNNNKKGIGKFSNDISVYKPKDETFKRSGLVVWYKISSEGTDYFKSIVKNLIQGDIGNLCIYDFKPIRLRDGNTWDKENYNEFLTWFMYNSMEISKFFGVVNLFKVTNNDEIKYGAGK